MCAPTLLATSPFTQGLTHTFSAHRNVSIKIAKARTKATNENDVYRHLQQNVHLQKKYPRHNHVLLLRDDFYIDGLNGRHLCVVTEVLGPSVEIVLEWNRMEPDLTKRVMQELLEAVAYDA